VPCFNEAGNLPELVERTERVFDRRDLPGEIVLVDDGSTDGTGPLIDALAASHPRVVGVHHGANRGIVAGWKSALEHSRGRWVCTIDADLQNPPEAIARLWREARFSGADLVQGWRSTMERGRYDFRYYMSRGLDHLLKIAFAMHEHDVKSGFVLYKREVFEDILAEAPRFYYLQHMITVVAKAKGYSIRQVETLFEERRAGQSFISRLPLRMIARTVADVGRGVVELRLREPRDRSFAAALAGLPDASEPLPPAPGRAFRNAPAYLGELRRTQWLPRDAIEQLQLRRVRRIVRHAWEHVGYWREALQAAGVGPDDIRTLGDLGCVPILTKVALRENIHFDILSDNSDKRKIEKRRTSGAQGEPLGVYADRLELDLRWANLVRHDEWIGVPRHGARIRLERSPAGATPVDERRPGTLVLPATVIDERLLARLTEALRARPVALLEGDTEALVMVAQRVAARGIMGLHAGAIVTGGQTLAPAARALIEQHLGGSVFDRYGLVELGDVAQECEARAGYHVNAESHVVEIVGEDDRPVSDGEVGTLVVTDLNNRCVPLLRYRTGDLAVAVPGACPCGRALPRIARICGRTPAAIAGTEGRQVPASVFADVFAAYEYAVRRYELAQESGDRLDVRLVRTSRFTRETEDALRGVLAGLLGPGMTVRFEPLDTVSAGVCVSRVLPPLPLAGAHTSEASGKAAS